MRLSRILISGAGIAGPALALCLRDLGCELTLVERAPALREGGQAVDFRGPVHRDVLERLDLWQAIHERRTQPGPLELIDAEGKTIAALPEVMLAGDVEILRGDLCRILYERTCDHTEYRFGDRITGLHERMDGVEVTFERGATGTFDLVIGADGLHSGTRQLSMGDESGVLRHHGYHLATFGLPGFCGRRRGAVSYAEPGRSVAVFASSPERAGALLIHAESKDERPAREVERQKADLLRRFEGMGWRAADVLRALPGAKDLYVDSISTVHLESYSRGRVALLGDAAWGGTLGGQGTSLAIVGAYVLARELARSASHSEAFDGYERRLRPYATGCQKGAFRVGEFFAPRSAFGLSARNLMYRALTSSLLSGVFERLVKSAASDVELPSPIGSGDLRLA